MYLLYYRLCSCLIQLKRTINIQQLWLSYPELAKASCFQSAPCDVLRLRQRFGWLSPICSASVHINIFNWIWQNRIWTALAPVSWMTNSHTYLPSYVYRASAELDRIGTWITLKSTHNVSHEIFKYYKAMVSQWSAHQFMTIFHSGMCSIWID